MVAFIGNALREKVSGENFDESIVSRQNSSDFSPVKLLRYTVFTMHFMDASKLVKFSVCIFTIKEMDFERLHAK